MTTLKVNGKSVNVQAAPDTPLSWVVRDEIGLKGSKFGCGAALCGACTMHVDGVATRSCVMPVGAVEGRSITTIEGLSGPIGQRLKTAWIEHQVPQCGYCQSGMLMAAAALLAGKPNPSDADIDGAITNICRCGTYARIRIAIHAAKA
jgi:isoquinoline 1-oxidoreductase alpha subunit